MVNFGPALVLPQAVLSRNSFTEYYWILGPCILMQGMKEGGGFLFVCLFLSFVPGLECSR